MLRIDRAAVQYGDMAATREFLNWDKGALPRAAEWLIARAENRNAHRCDLRQTLCVMPGRRAGRLLLGHLIVQCHKQKLQPLPPTILTPGQMIDQLLEVHQPLASAVESQWAWAAALKRAEAESIAALLPRRPADDDWRSWLELAQVSANLHEQLAGGRVGFADVADLAQRREMFGESDRWQALDLVFSLYHDTLKQCGLCDAHQARESRLAELAEHPEAGKAAPAQTMSVVLIGVAELNELQRASLASCRRNVTALIHAPAEFADRFDAYGCVVPNKWEDVEIGLRDEQIVMADRPTDQAQEALRAIAAWGGKYSAGEITIGLGNAELVRALQHAGEWAGVPLRSAEGAALGNSPPCRALKAIGEWLDDNRFAPFAAMLRHPDIEQWVWKRTRDADAGVSDWLSLLDRYFADHLHERIAEEWLGDDATRARMQAVHGEVCELIAPLTAKPLNRAVGEWCQPILDVLTELYEAPVGSAGESPERRLRIDACTLLRDALAEFYAAPLSLQPRVNAAQAIELALELVAGQSVPDDLQHDQIEMLGWLELHLDDAPALVIAGFNEGDIPQSASADPFLPDSLRASLGLPCNATRYARDAYLIEAMRHSRAELKVIAGRTSASGEPLTPSRLLLTCESNALVKRIATFCGENEVKHAPPAPIGLQGLAAVESKFVVPALPAELPIREAMSITEFRQYLACPYRYALSKLLRLEAMDDSATELDALKFGSLAHDVLCEFGRDDKINASEDAEKIERYLLRVLDGAAPREFGKSRLPAIAVQMARLQQRLRSFARLQAQLNAEGWRIRHCELEFKGNVQLDVPGQAAMPLRGVIDRIDYNDKLKQWRIIDYKTGETAMSPHKSHHDCEKLPDSVPKEWAWHDLQLPLYHYLARQSALNITGEISLAYICLPKQADGVDVSEAKWPREFLDHAINTAREVVRNIRAGKFAINRDYDGSFDEFARICQTSAFVEREPAEAEE
jgi:ATP-dependent helicase/nuclease subunit B